MRVVSLLPCAAEVPATIHRHKEARRICSKHGPRVAGAVEMLTHLLHPGILPGEADPTLALSWHQAYGEVS